MVMSKKRSREDAGLSAEGEAQLPFAGPYTEGGLLQLQATELIAARSVDYARDDALESVLSKLQKDLAKLPQRVIAKPSKEVKQYLDVHCMPQRPLRFHPPASVRLIGSWAVHTAAQPSVGVDVAVEMPRACFDEKDHLNHRYFARRAQYLGELAAALRKTPSFRQVSWEFLGHDARKPVLVIRPQPKGKDKPLAFPLRLIPIIAPGTIPLQKLAPDRNCIRPAATEAATPDEQPRQELPPTPLYNAALLQDMLVDVQQAALQEAVAALPQLPDAIILLKVWARAQGLEQEPDSFNGFLLSMLAAHLATTGTLTPAMSPLQMARAVMQTLSKEGVFSRGVAMKRRDPGAPGQQPAANVFRERHGTLFIDPSGFLNLAVHLSQSGLAQAQHAARRAVMLLDRPADAVEVFEAVFLNPLPRGAPFNAFWRVSVPLPQHAASLSEDVPHRRALEARVEALVTQALGTRAKAVRGFRQQLGGAADLAEAGSPAGATLEVFVAAQMDPATAQRAQDVGPPLDSPKASAFLDFWGNEIAEKTRFQDGHLAYAVTWEQPGSASATRHAIADRAVAHALKRHLAEGTRVTGHAALLDNALAQKGTPPDGFAGAHRALTAAVRNLTMKLRATSALPLRIVAVQPMSAALRDTAAFPPLPHPLATANLGAAAWGDLGRVPRCLEPLELLVQLEGSGRWPDHPEAFLKAKAAMGCQLADELATGFGLRTSASQSCVDVFAEGYAFRLFLSSDRDQAMAAKMSSPDEATLGSPGGQLAARATFGALQRQLAHHALMSALAGTAPAFPPTARMAHRWFSSQMLSNQICQEAGELLVAAAFSLERGLPVPGTRLGGFLRFLSLVASLGERTNRALVIDSDSSLGDTDRAAAVAALAKASRQGSGPALALVTPYDTLSEAWTRHRPSAAIVRRAAALAARSLTVLREHIELGRHSPEAVRAAVFGPAIADFDVLLFLRRDALPWADRAAQPAKMLAAAARKRGFAPLEGARASEPDSRARAVLRAVPEDVLIKRGPERVAKELLVGFDPVSMYVAGLERRFDGVATFCSDSLGGPLIGVKWTAQVLAPHQLAVHISHAVRPVDASSRAAEPPAKKAKSGTEKQHEDNAVDGQRSTAAAAIVRFVALDAGAALEDMRVMGAGLVEEIWQKGPSSDHGCVKSI